jgi:hypothetical protein
MQKFTRPITREIELAGERLAVTFAEQGVAFRPVGSRKPPWELTWAALLGHATGASLAPGQQPSAEQVAEAVRQLKTTTPPTAAAPAAVPATEESREQQPASVTAGAEPVSGGEGLFPPPGTP